MLKTESRSLTYTLTLLGALNLACASDPVEGTAGASEASTGDTDGSASAASTAPTTTTQGSESNSATESTVSGNSDAMTQATTDDVTTEAPTGTGTTSQLDTSNTGTSTSTSTGPGTTDTGTGTSGDTTGGTSTTGGDTTTTGGDTTTTGDTSTGEPVDCGLQLKATIRDFKVGHPDFETYCCGVVTGLVKPDLGADKKPAFNQVGNPKMLTDAPTFNQWYNTTNGINMPTQIVLDLQEIQPGVFSYQNNSFFPIDNQLFGNEGNGHNFHFTTVPDTS